MSPTEARDCINKYSIAVRISCLWFTRQQMIIRHGKCNFFFTCRSLKKIRGYTPLCQPFSEFPQPRHFKSKFFCAVKTSVLTFCARKKALKNHLICVKHEEKNGKKVKIHFFKVCARKSQDLHKVIKILRGRTTVRP